MSSLSYLLTPPRYVLPKLVFGQSHTEFRFPAYPHLTSLIVNYSEGTLSLGPYWERPGKDIVDRHLVDIPEPNDVVPGDMFEKLELVHFTGEHHHGSSTRIPTLH